MRHTVVMNGDELVYDPHRDASGLERPVRMKAQYRRKLKDQAAAARLGKRLSALVTHLA